MAASGADPKKATSIYEFSAKDIDGQEVSMDKYKGKLQELFLKYSADNFAIAAFPCNQFGGQEPWPEPEIKKWLADNFKVTFDMYSKIDVNGSNAHPIFVYLKSKLRGTLGDFIKWNFSKFLISKEGIPLKRFGPNEAPFDFENEIVKVLGVAKK